MNRAVTSLTLGIMSIFIPVAGLIIGIFGLTQANRALKEIEESEGKSFAVGGKVCSIIGMTLQSLLLLFIVIGFVLFSSF